MRPCLRGRGVLRVAAPGELAEAGGCRSRADGGGAGTVYSESLSVERRTESVSFFFTCFPQTCAEFLKIVIFVHISLYKTRELLYNIMAKVIYMGNWRISMALIEYDVYKQKLRDLEPELKKLGTPPTSTLWLRRLPVWRMRPLRTASGTIWSALRRCRPA